MPRRGPDLLSVDHPLVPIQDGSRLHVGEVRPGVGLGVSLAPDVLAGEDPGQEMLLLLLGADVENGVAEHADRERVVHTSRRDAGLRELLDDGDRLDLVQPLSAVLLRPLQAQPATGGQFLPPVEHELEVLVTLERSGPTPVGGQILVQPRLGSRTDGSSRFGIGEIHGRSSV